MFLFIRFLSGIWGYISSVHVPDNFHENMKEYLLQCLKTMGSVIFLETFFGEQPVSEEEYLENLDQLHRNEFSDEVRNAKSLLGKPYYFIVAIG